MYRHSFVYVPRGAIGMHLLLVEHDRPRSRKVTLRDSKGAALLAGDAARGYVSRSYTFGDNAIDCEVSLRETDVNELLHAELPFGGRSGKIKACWNDRPARL